MSANLTLVQTMDDVHEFKRWLGERRDVLAFDTETGGLDWWREPLRMFQFGDTSHGWAFNAGDWLGVMREVFDQYEGPFVAQNAKFDWHFSESAGVKVPRHKFHDTMLMAHIVDPTRPTGLKDCADRYLGAGCSALEAELSATMRKGGWTWRTIPADVPIYWQYAALDTVLTARLFALHNPYVSTHQKDSYHLELAVQQVLFAMERRGIRVDFDYIDHTKDLWDRKIENLEDEALTRWGVKNPNANPQVYKRLAEDGVSLVKRTPTGKPQLTDDVLKSLDHPLAKLVRQLRALTKLRSTYLDSFNDLHDGGYLHASVKQVGARTARMSISRPALQTLPRGRAIREAFIPSERHSLLLADYEGIEMRLLASYANVPAMLDAYRAGIDVHTYVAQRAFRKEDVSKNERQKAKNGSFGKIYGSGAATFARTIGITIDEAEQFLAAYDREFPEVREFQEAVGRVGTERLHADGMPWIKTFYGRKIPCDRDKIYALINYLIQGTAAEVLKKAMVELDAAGAAEHLVLPVHDELVFDAPREDVSELAHVVNQVMTNNDFTIPLTVKTTIAQNNWGEAYPEDENELLEVS